MSYTRNTLLNGTTIGLALLLPGAIHVLTQWMVAAVVVGWSMAALWYVLFPRVYKAEHPVP